MTLPAGLNPEQIVEIFVLTEEGTAKCSYGSGYQLATGLVATARHVVRGKRERPLADGLAIQVRFSARQSVETSAVAIGHVRWEGSAIDLALLELDWPGAAPDWPISTPVLGDVPLAARTLTYEALGYPYAKEVTLADAGKLRDSEAARGRVSAQDNLKTGALQLRTGVPTEIDQWEGFSGAPVFVNKFFVGVVTHDDAGDLRACRLSIAVGEGPRVDVDSAEPEPSARMLRALLAGHGIDPRTLPARRQPIYRQTIEDLRPPGGLVDRDDEIADLTAFATADPNGELTRPYLDWTGVPGAGATRLAAEFAAMPPPGVDLIAFFATRGVAGQTDEFLTHACDQLAAVLDDPPPAPGPADSPLFASLWRQASEQARATGRPLMLLIEGLDCDGPLHPMIADSIPANGDGTARIAVFRRDEPGLRLPASHPLRSPSTCTRRDLRAVEIARERREADRAQLEGFLAAHPQAATILDLVAIAGPLTGAELASLLGEAPAPDADPLAAVRQLKEVSDGMSQAVDAGVLRPEPDEAERFDFAEDAVRRMTAERWVSGTADAYRRVILAWAERYAARGWPDDTPPYLMTRYPSMLSGAVTQTTDAAAALDRLATPERTAAVRRAAGDAAAVRELTLVLGRMASSAPPDLPAICRLALRREQLVRSQAFAPVTLIDPHARLGHWSRARELAEQLQMPMDRVSALLQVASAAAEAGRDRFADLAFEQALRSCAALDPAAWPERTTALQMISGASAATGRLIDPDAVVEMFPDRTAAVMSLIGFVVSYARAGHPVWASRFVIRAAALADSLLPTPGVPAPADSSWPASDAATGHPATDVATRQKAFQDYYNAVQTVLTGALVLARMAVTAGQQGTGEDPLTALRRHVSAAAKAIEAVPDPALRPTAIGELGVAAAQAGHPEVVAELMATAVATAGDIVDPASRAWALWSLSPALRPDVRGAGELVSATAGQLVGITDPAARAAARAWLVPAAADCESDAAALFAAARADAGQLAAPGMAVGGPAVLETLAVAAAACRWPGPVAELAAGCADPAAWSRAHSTLAAAAVSARDTALAVRAVDALRDPTERINAYLWLTDLPAALGELGAGLYDAARREAATLTDAGHHAWALSTIAQKAMGVGLIAPARAAIADLKSPMQCATLLAAAAATPAARSVASGLIAEALDWATQISDANSQRYAYGAIADAALAAGDLDGIRRAVANLGDPYEHALGLAQVAWAAALTEATPSAGDALAVAISAAQALPDSRQRAYVFAALAKAALESHQPDLAEQFIAVADDDVGQADRVLQSGTVAALSAASGIGPARSAGLFEQACRIALVDELPQRLAALYVLGEYAARQPRWPENFAPFASRAQAATTPLERSQAFGGLAAATARAGEPAAALTIASRLEDPAVKIQTLVGLARPAVLAADPGSAETALRLARATADSLAPTASPGTDPIGWASGEIVGAALGCRLLPLADEMATSIRDPGLASAASAASAAIANLDATAFWWAPSPYSTGYYTLAVVWAACSAGRMANLLTLPSTVADASSGAFLAAEIAEAAIAAGDADTAQAAVAQAPATVDRSVRGRLGAVAVRLLEPDPTATAAELARRLADCLTPELVRRAAEREPLVLDAVAAELSVVLPPA